MDVRRLTALVGPSDWLAVYASALCGLWFACLAVRSATTRWIAAVLMAAVVSSVALTGAIVWASLDHRGLTPPGPAYLLAAAGGALVVGLLIGLGSAVRGARDTFIRGATVVTASGWHRWISFSRRRVLRVAGQAVGSDDESRHFKIVGTTGTGKTTAILQLMEGALARGDSAIFADPDFGYARAFYAAARGDVILNPFDPRSARWDPFSECTCPHDADQLARSLIPDQAGDERHWRNYARVLCGALVRRLLRCAPIDRSSLYRLLVQAPPAELELLLRDSAAAPYLSPENGRFLASVRAIASTQLSFLEYLDQPAGAPVTSVRRWVRDSATRPACLFLPYRAGQIAALRAAIAAWMRLAIFECMETPSSDRRLWFIVDELDSLGPIDGLKDALVRLRKCGGRCVLGFQSIAQVGGTYGRFDAQTIVENCGNSLVLRCSSSGADGTSQFASRLIGEREVLRPQLSRTRRGASERGPGARTTALHRSIECAVLAAEVEQLADFAGFLKFASRPEWRRIEPGDWRV